VLDVLNGAARPLAVLVLTLQYVSDGALVLIDECRLAVRIDPATVRPVTCPRQGLDAQEIIPRVAEVRFR